MTTKIHLCAECEARVRDSYQLVSAVDELEKCAFCSRKGALFELMPKTRKRIWARGEKTQRATRARYREPFRDF